MLLHSSYLVFTVVRRNLLVIDTVNSDENIVKKVLEEILVAVVEDETQAALNNQEENVISTASDVLPVAPVASSDINYPTISYKKLANHLSLNSNSVIETELNTRGLMKEHESICSDNQIMDMQILSDAFMPSCEH